MHRPAKLRGVQWISYEKLATDIGSWTQRLPREIAAVSGIPRSGLTVAQMLAAELHVPFVPIESLGNAPCGGFRPYCGRPLRITEGKVFIVDDCASFGNAIRATRKFVGSRSDVLYGAVYSRPAAFKELDHCFALHAEPDWLVVTQWNVWSHPDARWIVADFDAISGRNGTRRHVPRVPLAAVVSTTVSRDQIQHWLIENHCPVSPIATGDSLQILFDQFPNAALLATNDLSAVELTQQTPRAVLNLERSAVYNSGWTETVFPS